MRSFVFAAAVATAAAESVLLWQQHEDASVYTSASLARHSGTTPTFGTATWLNNPIFVEVSRADLVQLALSHARVPAPLA